ncbi:MAG: phospho-sugar mutase [Treponema sp.]|jgi:phosphoglucomutase|nr:phospho-sugar mutase [Treponema sp.]
MEKEAIVQAANDYIVKEKNEAFSAQVKELLKAEDWKELEDRFYRTLEFGTGGLRGVIGGGLNRMNTFVVKSATQGLASYIAKAFPEKAAGGTLSAVVAYDSRHYSPEFAEATALVFAGNGVKTYLFSSLRPTPELSFAIRRLGCETGVVVTASHNPKQYNGYKAYWNDGAQVIPPHDENIIKEVNAVTEIKELDKETAIAQGLLKIIDKEIDEPYQDMVRSKLFRPELVKAKAGTVKVVYTPLHGVGAMHVETILSRLGLKVITVPEQREGDGDFPTVTFPNPEKSAAMEMSVNLGKAQNADVVMATDPDADRFGIAAPDGAGGFTLITGNQMGALLEDYIFLSLKEQGRLPKNAAMVNTIVTTGMHKKIAEFYGATCLQCLTGFKWIADLMRKAETGSIPYTIVFGTEESYGYLVENEIRDKDGVSAAAMTAEMTLYWRSQGKSLLDRLNELYQIAGYWEELSIEKYFEGIEGPAVMKGIMEGFRKYPPKTLGGIEVEKVKDIGNSITIFPNDPNKKEAIELPKSDVIQFFLKDGTVVSARPSGTEPKIKFYATCCAPLTDCGLADAKQSASRKLAAIKTELKKAMGEVL